MIWGWGSIKYPWSRRVSPISTQKAKECNTSIFLLQMLVESVDDKAVKTTVFLFSEGFEFNL